MAAPKAKTNMERMGFVDEDLKSVDHDRLIIWLDENKERVIQSITKPITEIKEVQWEYPIIQKGGGGGFDAPKFVIGFVDYAVFIRFGENKMLGRVYFEAKTKIPSLGELLRQLVFYRTYSDYYTKIVVLSTDDKYRKQIESAGYTFVNPEDYK